MLKAQSSKQLQHKIMNSEGYIASGSNLSNCWKPSK